MTSKMILSCNETLFEGLHEPLRSIGYRVHILKQSYDYIGEISGYDDETVEAIATEAICAAFKIAVQHDLNNIKQKLPEGYVREERAPYQI